MGRPLIADTANMGAADIALTEIIEEKTGWELPENADYDRSVSGREAKKNKKA